MHVDVGRMPERVDLFLKRRIHLTEMNRFNGNALTIADKSSSYGWQWPTDTVTIPANMSKYRLPLSSHSHCIFPE